MNIINQIITINGHNYKLVEMEQNISNLSSTPILSLQYDFNDGNGPVPAHQHVNPDGSVGGWIADTAQVAATAYIGPDAVVFGNAQVSGDARVYGSALVYGNARVYRSARVYGSAQVSGDTWVCGNEVRK